MRKGMWLVWAVVVFGFMVAVGCSDDSTTAPDGDITDGDITDTAEDGDIEEVEDSDDSDVDKDSSDDDPEPDGDIDTDGDIEPDGDVEPDGDIEPDGDMEETEEDMDEEMEDDMEPEAEESVPVTVVPFSAITSGGGLLHSSSYSLQLFISPLRPVGETGSSNYGLKLGPAAVVGRGIQE